MTSNPTKDRNYYRMLDNEELIDMAREADNDLALVLAERLKKERTKHWNKDDY